jgi:membrane associated rhomboid family serine protease
MYSFATVRIGLLFVISGFGGSLLSALFLQSNISVGASGALFGLLGGMLSELITNWSTYDNKVHIKFLNLYSLVS